MTLILILIFLLMEGFFSGSEIGVVSADQMKLRHDAAKGSRGAKLALEMLKKPEWLLSTTLVGTNIAVVSNTTIVTALMIELFGEQNSWFAIILVAPLIWIFGEIVPKSIFQQRANTITPRAIFLLRLFSYMFYPILTVFTLITRLLTWSSGEQKTQNPFILREEILTTLQMPVAEGDIQPVEKDMIQRIFSFSETTAYEVMIPLIDVAAIEQGVTCGEAIALAHAEAHIRLPVYAARVDKVVGVLNALELLDVEPHKPIKSFIRDVRFVPPSKDISELLLDLRKDGDTVAVVVDEFGGAAGLVTMEDIMEEVVEEMEDEYEARCQQRFVTVYDVGRIERPAGQETRDDVRYPQEQARDTDNRDTPKDRQVIELLEVGPAIARWPFTQVEEVLDITNEIRHILGLRHHGIRAPEHAAFLLECPANEDIEDVHEHVAERSDRRDPVQEAG